MNRESQAGQHVQGSVVALCGGVGGAKLALGLAHALPAERLTIVVNTGDDFSHFGLHVSPDIDTVLYTLSGRVNPETGWGRAGETWRFMEAVGELGGETWFSLGDSDLATHAVRTARLAAGESLTAITSDFAKALGIGPQVLPASDAPIATMVETAEGTLPFQRYFVGQKCAPAVKALRFAGAQAARPSAEVAAALSAPDLGVIILCPSNPYLSIDPILAIAGMRGLIEGAGAPVVAVSPLVGGRAVKGPLAKMMDELGHARSNASILAHYEGLIDLLLIDERDRADAGLDPRLRVAPTMMKSLEERIALARAVLEAAGSLRRKAEA
ncbi:2-phospho-L-lactate transferase [Afifella pfennigii]|uniref:2-phospho-L-lactate transferase n=1 Tax=Afifella pfennigii TaxID=209897 RepID=UPI0005551133|nr:2-phospho-L-lactate transferase [Afifella pfennigii]